MLHKKIFSLLYAIAYMLGCPEKHLNMYERLFEVRHIQWHVA